jgi:hypothetical protein
MKKLTLHPRDYVVYAHNAITRVTEILLERKTDEALKPNKDGHAVLGDFDSAAGGAAGCSTNLVTNTGNPQCRVWKR